MQFSDSVDLEKIAWLINFEALSVKRATSLGIHQIDLEDASGLEPLHFLNFLNRLGLDDWSWFTQLYKAKEGTISSGHISNSIQKRKNGFEFFSAVCLWLKTKIPFWPAFISHCKHQGFLGNSVLMKWCCQYVVNAVAPSLRLLPSYW